MIGQPARIVRLGFLCGTKVCAQLLDLRVREGQTQVWGSTCFLRQTCRQDPGPCRLTTAHGVAHLLVHNKTPLGIVWLEVNLPAGEDPDLHAQVQAIPKQGWAERGGRGHYREREAGVRTVCAHTLERRRTMTHAHSYQASCPATALVANACGLVFARVMFLNRGVCSHGSHHACAAKPACCEAGMLTVSPSVE